MANPSEKEAGDNDRRTVTSVLRALRLLECFSHERPEIGLGDLARMSGLNKTTTHRLLATLEVAGWVERTPAGDHRLTLKAFEVGSIATDSIDLREEASRLMTELAAKFGDTLFLTVAAGTRAVCIERVEGQQQVRILALDVGKSLPLTVGGGPLALLAFNQENLLQPVLDEGFSKFTSQSLGSAKKLKERLAGTVERGYAISMEDVTNDVAAIGAPILDSSGNAVAAVSVAGLASRFTDSHQKQVAEALIHGCNRITELIRYHPSTENST